VTGLRLERTLTINVTSAQVGVLEVHAYSDSTEVEASVEVLGVGTFKTPFTKQLNAGSYTLKATYQDQEQTKTATVKEGVTTKVNFTFGVQIPWLLILLGGAAALVVVAYVARKK